MLTKIQFTLGKNAVKAAPSVFVPGAALTTVGQAVLEGVRKYLGYGLTLADGSELVSSIHSANLRKSAKFSARTARAAYILGKVTLLQEELRKGIVRTQIIEYGAVAEAILLDAVQSIGVHDKPVGLRPLQDARKKTISWRGDALFTRDAPGSSRLKAAVEFLWLIRESERMNVIDSTLSKRAHWLRAGRNLVHPVIPTPQRYSADIESAKRARAVVESLRDSVVAFKAKHGLP